MRHNNYLGLKKSHLALAISCAALPMPHLATAQAADTENKPVFEEVVVTGSRREENVMDIPINISAVGGEKIEDLRLDSIAKIAYYTPGLTVVDRGPRDENPDILVRGLNTGGLGPGFSSSTVATYLGDIPLQVDLKPIDLERVEVLIGPQGTLYGQGTMGGAIRYIPAKADPSGFTATVRSSASSNAESSGLGSEYGATLNFAITDNLAVRVNADSIQDPGFIDYNYVVRESGVSNPDPDFSNPDDVAANLRRVKDANGEDTKSGRINVRWLATDWLEANLWHYYQDTKAEGRQLAHQLSFNTGPYESGMRYEEPNHYTNKLTSIELIGDLGFAQATMVYGQSEYDELGQRDQTDLLLDLDYGYDSFPSFSAYTREEVKDKADTFELRMSSQHEGPFKWVAGYFQNEYQSDAISEEFTPFFDQFVVDNWGGVQLRPDNLEYIQLTDIDEKESAFYGELTYDITDTLSVTGGYRRYKFETDITGGFGLPLFETVFLGEPQDAINVDLGRNQGEDEGDLFKFNVAWDATANGMVYFTYSQGYRNGGVNSVPECTAEQIASDNQQLCALSGEVLIDPDKIDNYEVGYKGLVGDRLSVSTALYYIDWTDLQVATTTTNGSLPITGNGSAAISQGFELQGSWLISDNLDLAFTYAYTDAALSEDAPGLVGPYDVYSSARLPGHAEHQGSLNLNYTTTVLNGYDLDLNYGLVFASDVYNMVGGPEDPLYTLETEEDGTITIIDGDRGGEAIPGYAVHHMSATLRLDKWTVQAFADNLWDKYYITGTRSSRRNLQDENNGPGIEWGNGFTQRSYGQYVGTPRTIGARFTYEF
ncbi:TonB-dependent receptor [Microbulbifer agarilyticus]|uniref:TonB-dependent receptor n=1 Tax=Microbulbifer agarilyticus TaxID=260552 RepID=UPI001C95BEA2|nr:TonB-dependent receptor [Microbulbifer agarilyticus]MBY6190105.1 TonB-dependent receptor [Microbulbifer agarilyticus]